MAQGEKKKGKPKKSKAIKIEMRARRDPLRRLGENKLPHVDLGGDWRGHPTGLRCLPAQAWAGETANEAQVRKLLRSLFACGRKRSTASPTVRDVPCALNHSNEAEDIIRGKGHRRRERGREREMTFD